MKRVARIIGSNRGNRIEIKVSFNCKDNRLVREEVNEVVVRSANLIFNTLPLIPYHNFSAVNSRVVM